MWIQSTLLAAAFAIAASATAQAQDKGKAKADVSQPELKAKIDYCKTCHGVSGQGFRGSFPMPRLAGQQPEYLENQLQAFIDRRRTNPVMFNVAHVLSPSMLKGLAEHFKDLNPKPLGERRSMMKASRRPRFLHVPPVTGLTPKAPMHFPVWQDSSMTTCSGNSQTGTRSGAKTRLSRIRRPSWGRLRIT
jgi:cytochrome c553